MAGLLAGCGSSSATGGDARSLSGARVVDGRLVDAHGRQVLLRGVNVKAAGLFDASFTDGRSATEEVSPFDASDAWDIARLGFDFVRLAVSWSGLEPTEGAFSSAFLERLDGVIGWLGDAGLYVLVDFHEDAWSKEIGEDGAPLWAIVPPPRTVLEGPLWPAPDLPCPCTGDLNQRRTSLPVLGAFASFFEDREGIQQRFVPAWQLVTGRYARDPAVVGYEAMNEPVVIHVAHGTRRLEEFHRRMVAAMRDVSPRQAYFLEPDVVTRNLLLTAPGPEQPFPDGNVVYAPHFYPYSLPADVGERNAAIERSLASIVTEARRWGAAPLLGEWATGVDDPGSLPSIEAIAGTLDRLGVGWALWQWKDYGSPGPGPGSGSIVDYDWQARHWFVNQPGTDALTPPYAFAVPGRLVEQGYDAGARRFHVVFEAAGGEGAPLVSLPEHVAPQGFLLRVDGAAARGRLDEATRRLVVPWSGAPGRHTIEIQVD